MRYVGQLTLYQPLYFGGHGIKIRIFGDFCIRVPINCPKTRSWAILEETPYANGLLCVRRFTGITTVVALLHESINSPNWKSRVPVYGMPKLSKNGRLHREIPT
jgi:hypothetical protein